MSFDISDSQSTAVSLQRTASTSKLSIPSPTDHNSNKRTRVSSSSSTSKQPLPDRDDEYYLSGFDSDYTRYGEEMEEWTPGGRMSSGGGPTSGVTARRLRDRHRDEEYYGFTQFDDPNLNPFDFEAAEIEDESPYPEVRSAVANTDDPLLPSSTIRVWLIGLPLAVIQAGVNQILFFRVPAPTLNAIVSQLLSYPLGCAAAYLFPKKTVFGLPLNPGPFSIKEHVLLTVIASVGARSAYASDIVAVQRFYYGQAWNFSYQWFLVLSTQMIGFSIGGIAKRYLVSPPSMIWPNNLVVCALFNTLHSQKYAGVGTRQGIPREKFFIYAFIGSAIWYLFPGYLFTALSIFSWVCWIAPNDVKINQLFGYYSGLGMSILTFDWSQIVYGAGSPLVTPWWAQVNIMIGFFAFYWVFVPLLYYSGAWYFQYLPISARIAFDNSGIEYNVTRILTNSTFNQEAYKAYSPLFMPVTMAVSYGLSFAAITSILVHTFLHFRRQIWLQTRRSLREQPDIHARLMSRYEQVPDWWYMIIFATMFIFGVLAIEQWETQMPVWALILALVMALLYIIPVGMVQAVTNQQVGLNVITELIVGYMLPGKPIAMMMFKTWGYIGLTQGLTFTSDFKLGHYMKIPPKHLFWGQVIATIIAGTTQLGVQAWMFGHIPDMCTPVQESGFTCAATQTFATASIIWGVIGPGIQFSAGREYHALTYFFLLGAVAPIIAWLITKKWPNSFMRYVNTPVLFGGTGQLPPASALNFVPWAFVGFIFQFYVRRRHFGWWTKYNYVLSAALDAGVCISAILIYFCLQYPQHGNIGAGTIKSWWGNNVHKQTLDHNSPSLLSLNDGEYFGPPAGTW